MVVFFSCRLFMMIVYDVVRSRFVLSLVCVCVLRVVVFLFVCYVVQC